MSSPLSITIMPSENAFKKQAEAASDALKTFTAIRDSKSLIIVKAAIAELIDATIRFNNYVPFFVSHPLFQEIPPAVFNVLEEFSNKNPKFNMPSSFAKVVGLDARVKDSIAVAASKKGMTFFSMLSLSYISLSEAAAPSAGARGNKGASGVMRKPKNSQVSLLLRLDALLTLLQAKRPRLSKEIIDNSDDDGDQLAQFVKPAATLCPKPATFASVADAVNKVCHSYPIFFCSTLLTVL